MLEKLINDDPNFNEDMFKTKVDNMFIMLHMSVMTYNIDRVLHFLSNEMRNKYKAIIDDLKQRKVRQMYDELNVAETRITEISDTEDSFIINVYIKSRYMDYLVDMDGNFISGINDYRIEKDNYLVLTKRKNTKDIKAVRKCPGCGANISVNTSGKCEYCDNIFDQENYDWVISNIETR